MLSSHNAVQFRYRPPASSPPPADSFPGGRARRVVLVYFPRWVIVVVGAIHADKGPFKPPQLSIPLNTPLVTIIAAIISSYFAYFVAGAVVKPSKRRWTIA